MGCSAYESTPTNPKGPLGDKGVKQSKASRMQKARAGASAPDFAASANEHRCFGGKACAQELSCQGWYRSQSAVNCAQALQQTDVTSQKRKSWHESELTEC